MRLAARKHGHSRPLRCGDGNQHGDRRVAVDHKSIESTFADLVPELKGHYREEAARLCASSGPWNETRFVSREEINVPFDAPSEEPIGRAPDGVVREIDGADGEIVSLVEIGIKGYKARTLESNEKGY